MNKKLKILISAITLLLVGGIGTSFYGEKATEKIDIASSESRQGVGRAAKEDGAGGRVGKETYPFVTEMFDSVMVKNILPLGELNGGYEEASTITGLMIITKSDLSEKPDLEVRAPADMTLSAYSYHKYRQEPEAWRLSFMMDENLIITLDHIARVSQRIMQNTTTAPKSDSSDQYPKEKIEIKKGEVIGYTIGKGRTKSFNLYFHDKRTNNAFINQERFKERGQRYLTASCVVDYYEKSIQDKLIPLLGYDEPGQTPVCNKVTRDVKGTLSGMWFLDKEGLESKYDGSYASPFSIFLSSANEVILYEINRKRSILGRTNPTFKDPAQVTDSHCYSLQDYSDSPRKGYAYFKIVSETEMKMAFSADGSCPSAFPESQSKTYYR